MSVVDFKTVKEKRLKKKVVNKTETIVSDLKKVEEIMTTAIEALSGYKKYVDVMEALSAVQTSRTVLQIQLRKYENLLKKNEQQD